jgi:hypothetical protein
MNATIPSQNASFEQDVSAYLSVLPNLLNSSEGKFALIGNGVLVEVFESRPAAMTAGYAKYGSRGFLVQEVSRYDLEMSLHWHQ